MAGKQKELTASLLKVKPLFAQESVVIVIIHVKYVISTYLFEVASLNPNYLRLATYNIHSWIGSDGRRDQKRTIEVLSDLSPDVAALQEVTFSERNGELASEALERATGMQSILGPTLRRGDSEYGNVLLTKLPVEETLLLDISRCGCEPRGAIAARLRSANNTIAVVATHLGLGRRERRHQINAILETMNEFAKSDEIQVLFGDFNEYNPYSQTMRRMHSYFGRQSSPTTFPARCPVLRLDRIWAVPGGNLSQPLVLRTPTAKIASDHLPLLADLQLA